MLGICADPAHPEITVESVLASGAESVSLVLRWEDNDRRLAFARALRANGIGVLGIATDESIGPFGASHGEAGPTEAAQFYAGEGWKDVLTDLQLLNEPDLVSESSNTKEPAAALEWVYQWLAGWGSRGSTRVLAGGFASGDPSWLKPIWPELYRVIDAVAIHAYGMMPALVLSKRHNQIGEHPREWHWGRSGARQGFGWGFGDLTALVNGYQVLQGGPSIAITEIGAHSTDFDDEHARAQYVTNCIVELRRYGPMFDAWWFCLGPNMVPGYDLIAPNGEVLESYAAFVGSFGA